MDRSIKILVADDSALMREMMQAALESIGMTDVTFVVDGHLALEELTAVGGYQLLITDNSMPTLTGLQLTLHARALAQYPALRIIMISGDPIEKPALETGVDAFFLKPVELDRLSEAIAKMFP